MPLDIFTGVILKGRERAEEERLRANWTAMLPFMSLGWLKYQPFHEYKAQATGANIDRRPAQEIIAELEELHGTKLL